MQTDDLWSCIKAFPCIDALSSPRLCNLSGDSIGASFVCSGDGKFEFNLPLNVQLIAAKIKDGSPRVCGFYATPNRSHNAFSMINRYYSHMGSLMDVTLSAQCCRGSTCARIRCWHIPANVSGASENQKQSRKLKLILSSPDAWFSTRNGNVVIGKLDTSKIKTIWQKCKSSVRIFYGDSTMGNSQHDPSLLRRK